MVKTSPLLRGRTPQGFRRFESFCFRTLESWQTWCMRRTENSENMVRLHEIPLQCFGSSIGKSISLRTRGSQVRILPEVPDIAGCQQLVAGQAHNLKVGGSYPSATNVRMPEWSKGGCKTIVHRFKSDSSLY